MMTPDEFGNLLVRKTKGKHKYLPFACIVLGLIAVCAMLLIGVWVFGLPKNQSSWNVGETILFVMWTAPVSMLWATYTLHTILSTVVSTVGVDARDSGQDHYISPETIYRILEAHCRVHTHQCSCGQTLSFTTSSFNRHCAQEISAALEPITMSRIKEAKRELTEIWMGHV